MAERQTKINFGSQVAGGSTSGIGGSVSSGTGRGPASNLLDGLIANDNEQRALEKQRIREQRAEIKARQKEALRAFATTTQIQVEDNINRIANETPNNPQAIKTKGEGLISGYIDALPALARPVFQGKARKSLNQKIAVANKKAKDILRTKVDIEAGELQAQLVGKLRDDSKNKFSEDDDLRIASEEAVEATMAEMLAPFFETGEDFEGNEFPLFDEKAIDAQLDNIEAISLESGVEGWFDSQDNMASALMTIVDGSFRVPIMITGKDDPLTGELGVIINPDGSRSTERSISVEIEGKIFVIPTLVKGQIDPEGIAEGEKELTDKQVDIAIDRFVKRGGLKSQEGFKTEAEATAASKARSSAGGSLDKFTTRSVLDVLPDEGKGLLALLNTKMTARNRVNTEREAAEEKARTREQDLNLFDAYETIENPNSEKVRITPGEIEEMVLADELEPNKAIQLLKSATEAPAIENDPLLFALLTTMITNDQDIEIFVNDSEARLKPETLWQLRKQNKTNQDRLKGKVQTGRNKLIAQQRRILQRRIGITEGPLAGAFEKLDPTLEDRAALAVSEFDERITDPNLTNNEIRDIGDELVRRTRLVDSEATVFRRRLIKPRFLNTDKTRANITEFDIQRAGDNLEKSFANREIDEEEFLLEVKLINLQADEISSL